MTAGVGVLAFALPGMIRFLASLRNDRGGGLLGLCPIGNDEISRWRFEMTAGVGCLAFALSGMMRFLASLRNDRGEGRDFSHDL